MTSSTWTSEPAREDSLLHWPTLQWEDHVGGDSGNEKHRNMNIPSELHVLWSSTKMLIFLGGGGEMPGMLGCLRLVAFSHRANLASRQNVNIFFPTKDVRDISLWNMIRNYGKKQGKSSRFCTSLPSTLKGVSFLLRAHFIKVYLSISSIANQWLCLKGEPVWPFWGYSYKVFRHIG